MRNLWEVTIFGKMPYLVRATEGEVELIAAFKQRKEGVPVRFKLVSRQKRVVQRGAANE